MKHVSLIALLAAIMAFYGQISYAQSVVNYAGVLAGWDVHGLSAYGSSPQAATSTAPNVGVVGLTRGSGLTTAPSAAARAWGANGWSQSSAASTAVAANQFVLFALTLTNGGVLSITNISDFDYRRSTTGPSNGVLSVQIGTGTFTDLTNFYYSANTSSGGSLGAIDLSSFGVLQNVPSGTTVTFRLTNYHATSSAGTWYVFDVANSTALDFSLSGTISGGYPPLISQPPTGTNVLLGQTASFAVAATNTPPFSYQWLINGVSLPTATNTTLTLTNVAMSAAGSYSVIVSNAFGFTNSADAVLVVSNLFGPPMDNGPGFFSGENLYVTNFSGESWYVWSTTDPSLPLTAWNPEGATVEFPIVGTGLSQYGITVTPTASPEYYIFAQTNAGPFTTTEPLTVITRATDADAPDGYDYTVVATNAGISPAGVFAFVVAPIITVQPASLSLLQGQTAAFNVTATGGGLNYQWFQNNTGLGNATTSSLVLTALSPANAGNYAVVVSNTTGSVTSSVAMLAVAAPPSLLLTTSNGGWVLDGSVVTGLTYVVQSATNLAAPVWLPVFTNNTGGSGTLNFQPPAAGSPQQFYRLLFRNKNTSSAIQAPIVSSHEVGD